MQHTRFASLDATAAEQAARANHYEGEAASESFWKSAAQALPPHARRKYARLFEAAARYEPVVELVVDACSGAWRAMHFGAARTPRRRDLPARRTLAREGK